MPAFDGDNRPFDEGQITGRQNKRQLTLTLLRMRIQDEEINVIFFALGLGDVFPMLPHEKFVQFEIFTNNGFADGTHRTNAPKNSRMAMTRRSGLTRKNVIRYSAFDIRCSRIQWKLLSRLRWARVRREICRRGDERIVYHGIGHLLAPGHFADVFSENEFDFAGADLFVAKHRGKKLLTLRSI